MKQAKMKNPMNRDRKSTPRAELKAFEGESATQDQMISSADLDHPQVWLF